MIEPFLDSSQHDDTLQHLSYKPICENIYEQQLQELIFPYVTNIAYYYYELHDGRRTDVA
jgi:hypothetical protein